MTVIDESAQVAPPSPRHTRGLWWWLNPALVAIISAAALHGVISVFRQVNAATLPDGYRIQDWTSNWLMQTLGLEEMLPFGPMAFWYSHVYPPLQDMIRYVFTFPETSAGQPFSAAAVDMRLYVLYAVMYGLVNALLFIWVRSLTKSGWWALGVTLVWAVHPGYLTVMTLLDPSPLAMFFISLSLLLLYLFLRYRNLLYATGFFAALVVASLARTVTQVHVLAVLVVAVIAFWFIARKRTWWQMALNIALVATLFVIPVKMQILYATWDVTSYGGYHRAGPLWIDPRTVPQPIPQSFADQYQEYEQARLKAEDPAQLAQMTPDEIRTAQQEFAAAEQLWNQQRAGFEGDPATALVYPDRIVDNALKFSSRFNTREQVLDNYRLSAAANTFLVTQPVESAQRLIRSLGITIPEAFRPASQYTQNYLVEQLPWRTAWDWLFSSWRYALLILATAVFIGYTRGWLGVRRLLIKYGWFLVFYGLLALPIMFSNRFTPGSEDLGPLWTDAMRQKVFLELPIWALGGYALWLAFSTAGKASWHRNTTPSTTTPSTTTPSTVA
jgi:hypothetical protein